MLDTSVSTPPNCVADDELIHRAQVRPSADLQQKLVVLHAVDAQCADDHRSWLRRTCYEQKPFTKIFRGLCFGPPADDGVQVGGRHLTDDGVAWRLQLEGCVYRGESNVVASTGTPHRSAVAGSYRYSRDFFIPGRNMRSTFSYCVLVKQSSWHVVGYMGPMKVIWACGRLYGTGITNNRKRRYATPWNADISICNPRSATTCSDMWVRWLRRP